MHDKECASAALLGAGNMAEALANGWRRAPERAPEVIWVFDPIPERAAMFVNKFAARAAAGNAAAVRSADVIFLCVKPQNGAEVLDQIAPVFESERHLLVSILAGTTAAKLESRLPSGARVVRVMPNLPMLIGCGVAGMCLGKNARPEDARLTEQLCGAAAQTVRVEERLMDAVTAVSGSGPAYVFYLAEAMIAAGEAEGLTAAQARQLVVRTLFGAGKMLEDTGEDPAVLRRRVTSPGGTTAAALEVLEARGAREIWVAALRRAAERSRELGAR